MNFESTCIIPPHQEVTFQGHIVEWLRKIFSDPRTVAAIASSSAVGLVVGTVTGLIEKRHGGWAAFWLTLSKGLAVALMVGLGVESYVQSEAMRCCIVGAAVVISDDIWAGLRAIGRLLKEDPLGTLGRLFDAFRGRSTSTAMATPAEPRKGTSPLRGPDE